VRKNPARLAGKTGQFPVQNAHKTLKTLEDLTPQPPRGRGEEFFQDDAPTDAVPGSSAEALVDGLYRGLGVAPTTCTARRRKRELALAQDLVAVGATPAEAEAYARDSSNLPRRIAPVDMAAFERERPSWLARRRRPSDYDGPRFVVPTGPPPEQPPVDHAVWDRSMAKWMAERGRTWTPKNRTAI
jgi:hypothetical protein